ncbi:hypothetical protein HDU98_005781 [Podochytrium sp. JEL0797]|nr:hypothetical protein HDU98_005781 [Podochytrium sp. JEL0797]
MRWEDYVRDIHHQRLKQAKPTIDDSKPRVYRHLDMRLKKQQMEEERVHEIETNNNILFRRIMCQKIQHKEISDVSKISHYVDSRNHIAASHEHFRKRGMEKILKENLTILQRIEEKAPNYNRLEWYQNRSRNLGYLCNIAQYPKLYLDLLEEGKQNYDLVRPRTHHSPRVIKIAKRASQVRTAPDRLSVDRPKTRGAPISSPLPEGSREPSTVPESTKSKNSPIESVRKSSQQSLKQGPPSKRQSIVGESSLKSSTSRISAKSSHHTSVKGSVTLTPPKSVGPASTKTSTHSLTASEKASSTYLSASSKKSSKANIYANHDSQYTLSETRSIRMKEDEESAKAAIIITDDLADLGIVDYNSNENENETGEGGSRPSSGWSEFGEASPDEELTSSSAPPDEDAVGEQTGLDWVDDVQQSGNDGGNFDEFEYSHVTDSQVTSLQEGNEAVQMGESVSALQEEESAAQAEEAHHHEMEYKESKVDEAEPEILQKAEHTQVSPAYGNSYEPEQSVGEKQFETTENIMPAQMEPPTSAEPALAYQEEFEPAQNDTEVPPVEAIPVESHVEKTTQAVQEPTDVSHHDEVESDAFEVEAPVNLAQPSQGDALNNLGDAHKSAPANIEEQYIWEGGVVAVSEGRNDNEAGQHAEVQHDITDLKPSDDESPADLGKPVESNKDYAWDGETAALESGAQHTEIENESFAKHDAEFVAIPDAQLEPSSEAAQEVSGDEQQYGWEGEETVLESEKQQAELAVESAQLESAPEVDNEALPVSGSEIQHEQPHSQQLSQEHGAETEASETEESQFKRPAPLPPIEHQESRPTSAQLPLSRPISAKVLGPIATPPRSKPPSRPISGYHPETGSSSSRQISLPALVKTLSSPSSRPLSGIKPLLSKPSSAAHLEQDGEATAAGDEFQPTPESTMEEPKSLQRDSLNYIDASLESSHQLQSVDSETSKSHESLSKKVSFSKKPSESLLSESHVVKSHESLVKATSSKRQSASNLNDTESKMNHSTANELSKSNATLQAESVKNSRPTSKQGSQADLTGTVGSKAKLSYVPGSGSRESFSKRDGTPKGKTVSKQGSNSNLSKGGSLADLVPL